MSAFDLNTHFGAYLYRENCFRPNGLVGFVEMAVLHGYSDASGKAETATDKILVVAGALGTPDAWDAWKDEWQDYLLSEGFQPEDKHGRCIFHTSPFWSGGYKGMPQGLSVEDKKRVYFRLAGITKKHAIYRFGYGVVLDDFRKLVADFPHADHPDVLGVAGVTLLNLAVDHNSQWAVKKGFDRSIAYTLDFGDKHANQLESYFRRARKKWKGVDFNVASVTVGDDAEYPPIQAGDLVAWAMRDWCLTMPHKKLATVNRPGHKLLALMSPDGDDYFFRLHSYEFLKSHLFWRVGEIVKAFGFDHEKLLKPEHWDLFVRHALEVIVKGERARKAADWEAYKQKKK